MEFKTWLEENERLVRRSFGQLPLKSYKGKLYHGTSERGMICIAKNGFQLYTHRELCGEFFSTSRNPKMVRLAGGSGFEFDINFDKVLVLNDFYYELLRYEGGGGIEDSEKDVDRKIQQAKRLGLKDRFGHYGIGDACGFFGKYLYGNPRYREVKGIFVPGFDSSHENAEAEIAVTEVGLSILKDSVSRICIDGRWMSVVAGWAQLRARAEEVDDDQCYNVLSGEKW